MRTKTPIEIDISTTLDRCFGNDIHGWTSAAAFIKRAQVHDRMAVECTRRGSYPLSRKAWFTDSARFLGIGTRPVLPRNKGERLLFVSLPFDGCGADLHRCARIARATKMDLKVA
jgi:hypothetical protein